LKLLHIEGVSIILGLIVDNDKVKFNPHSFVWPHMDFWIVWKIQRKNRYAMLGWKIHGWGKMKLLFLSILIKKTNLSSLVEWSNMEPKFIITIIYWLPIYQDTSLISPMKSIPHFMKGSKARINLNGFLPFCHIGPKCWHTSHVWTFQ
jgi:hypothetical protein